MRPLDQTVERRGRRAPLLLAAIAAVLVLSACTPQQVEIIERVNTTRAQHGLEMLRPHPSAMDKAQAWAETMAADQNLRHSDLRDGISGDWKVIGENVGYSGTIAAVHDAFMQSPGHRENLLDPRFNFMGSGYAESDDGRVWVVQVFVQY